ncbi:hybrid sensor histidine kinase/response regulator [Paraburkholderia ginsengisoli]|nr:hybrid sensor histidine kinase/response regulator [Paraburkholderia ginsengisoli]
MKMSAITWAKLRSLPRYVSGDFRTWRLRLIHSGAAFLLVGFAIFCGALSSADAQTSKAVVVDHSRDTIDLWNSVALLSDPTHSLTIDDVLAKQDQFRGPLRTPHANLGQRSDTVWLRADIAVSEDAPLDWWLSIDFIYLDEIDLYVVEKGRVVQSMSVGEEEASAKPAFAFHQPVFQLALESGRQYELVIRIRKYSPNAMLTPISLIRTGSLIEDEASTQFWRAIMLGVGGCFVAYALFTAALKRDPLCLWFALFAICSTVYASAYYGFLHAHLWPGSSGRYADIIARYCMLLRSISCFLFVDLVLDLRKRSPRTSWLLKSLTVFFTVLTSLLVTGLISRSPVALAFSLIGTLPLLLLVPFVLRRAAEGDPLWDRAVAGVTCYAIGMIVGAGLHYGLFPWNRWTESIEHLGALLNMTAWLVVISIRTHRRQRAAEVTAVRERQAVARLAVDLKRQKEIAEEASRAKSRFLAAASHDLRQPVHAMSLFIGALRNVPMNDEGQHLIRQIEMSADAIDRLFAALLDISKLDAGVVKICRQAFPIDTVLARVCDDYSTEAAAKGLTLSYVRSRAIVDSDPALVERIARNLISNAVRYTDAGRIVVGCRRRGSSVAIQVWDTGRGIPLDQQELVFQEYYQVHNPESDRAKGLGLGLAIVRRVSDLLECDLRLRSTPGQGSCFEIALPRVSEAVTPVGESVDEPSATSASGLVVVIDDEKAIRTGMSALLSNWGYEVLTAGSADEAIQLLAGHTAIPDLLICDLRLRDGENGIEVIERLRTEYNSSIPAMLITGDTAADRLVEVQASELLVLHKPVPNSKLRAATVHLMTAAALSREANTE